MNGKETIVSFTYKGTRLATVYMFFVPRKGEYVTLDGETFGVSDVTWIVNSPYDPALKEVSIVLVAERV